VADRPVFLDATTFLGMHHVDATLRRRSLGLFTRMFHGRVYMNYEQVGICDAVIWKQSRAVQDTYYPFMDLLHSVMAIVRGGYSRNDLVNALERPELRQLQPEQALQVAQVLGTNGWLATHDPALRALGCLEGKLWAFEEGEASAFPPELQALYPPSTSFVYDPGSP
jgi:Family of unknown function (DUF6190)